MRRVVITGLGIISPVGNTVDEYWESLSMGKCGIDFITKFDTSDYKVKVAAEVKNFDPRIYYPDKTEIRKNDLFVQYAIAAAVQAVSDSGLSNIEEQSNFDKSRMGVYIGSGIGGMQTLISEAIKHNEKGPSRVSPHFIPMMISNMASGAVAIRYGAMGPSLPVVTACATSTNAIGEAYHAIKHNYADIILAGGTEASITPLAVAGFTSAMALSQSDDPQRSSIPFDKERSGFVMGEGAAVLVLEEYENAKARGAKIYAELCGYGNTCDAYHATAPHPDGKGAASAISIAIKEANLNGNEKIYFNAHGTSTPLNDRVETIAIKKAFGEQKAKELIISSTKSMTGHMLGAAGSAELIASVLAMKNSLVPPTIGYLVPDEDCDLDYVPNKARELEIDIAVSSSLGFGGHNSCIVIKKIKD